MRAKIIEIDVEQNPSGLMHATSRSMRELLVSGHSMDELFSDIPIVISEIYSAHGHAVDVFEAEHPGSERRSFVVVSNERLLART